MNRHHGRLERLCGFAKAVSEPFSQHQAAFTGNVHPAARRMSLQMHSSRIAKAWKDSRFPEPLSPDLKSDQIPGNSQGHCSLRSSGAGPELARPGELCWQMRLARRAATAPATTWAPQPLSLAVWSCSSAPETTGFSQEEGASQSKL